MRRPDILYFVGLEIALYINRFAYFLLPHLLHLPSVGENLAALFFEVVVVLFLRIGVGVLLLGGEVDHNLILLEEVILVGSVWGEVERSIDESAGGASRRRGEGTLVYIVFMLRKKTFED